MKSSPLNKDLMPIRDLKSQPYYVESGQRVVRNKKQERTFFFCTIRARSVKAVRVNEVAMKAFM